MTTTTLQCSACKAYFFDAIVTTESLPNCRICNRNNLSIVADFVDVKFLNQVSRNNLFLFVATISS
jgi:hypothetical protein